MPFHTFDGFIDIHSFNQCCNALCIAGAAAYKMNIGYLIVFLLQKEIALEQTPWVV